MAIAFLAAQVIGRSSGRSATAAAAYRAGARIVDARTGEVHDFTRKVGVRESFILAPDAAPAWMCDRDALWNGVEASEKRKDAQLARELVVALPHELPATTRRQLIVGFVSDEFVARGMVADVALHAPGRDGDNRNEHAHVMLTMRQIDGESFGKKVTAWNDRGLLEIWKESWASRVNLALETHGIAERIDHRSPEVQAVAAGHDVTLANLATVHLGPAATRAERRGERTELGDLNREVRVINLELERMRRAAKVEASAVAEPAPVAAPPETETLAPPPTRERLQRELQTALGLSAIPGGEDAREAIRRQRDELPELRARKFAESEALQAAARRLEETKAKARNLNKRFGSLQARRAALEKQASDHNAAQKWRSAHRLRAWLHDHGIFRSAQAAGLVKDTAAANLAWNTTRRELMQVESQLGEVQAVQQEALRERAQRQAELEQEAHQAALDAAQRLDRAEVLAEELRRVEDHERQRQELAAQQAAEAPTPRQRFALDLEKLELRPRGPRP